MWFPDVSLRKFSQSDVPVAQAGDHVHLGPGVMGTRKTDPAFPIEELPPIDAVVLSHFHAGALRETAKEDRGHSVHITIDRSF